MAAPNVRFPSGKMSHDVVSPLAEQYQRDLEDYVLAHGLFDLHGRLVEVV